MPTTARVARIHEYGPPEVLRFEDIVVGEPGDDEALIRNTVIGLNFVDVYYRRGSLPVPAFPAIIGDEAAGVVEAVGKNVPRRQRISLNVAGWFGSKLSQLSPRALSWSAATATLLIVVQAGVLTDVFVGREGQTYGTASAPSQEPMKTRSLGGGPHALIGFIPQARAADLTRFLDAYKASIVEGPRAGGLYRIQLQPGLSENDVASIVKRMQQDSSIVRFAAADD